MNFIQLKKALELYQELQCFGFSNITDLQTFATQNPDQFWKEIEDRKIKLTKEEEKTTKSK